MGQSCGTEPWTCGVWHCIWVDGVQLELNCRALGWCGRTPWWGNHPTLGTRYRVKEAYSVLRTSCPKPCCAEGAGPSLPDGQPVPSRSCTHARRTSCRSVSGRAYIPPRGPSWSHCTPPGMPSACFQNPWCHSGHPRDDTGWLSHRNHRLPLPEVDMGGPSHLCPTWAPGVLASIPALACKYPHLPPGCPFSPGFKHPPFFSLLLSPFWLLELIWTSFSDAAPTVFTPRHPPSH